MTQPNHGERSATATAANSGKQINGRTTAHDALESSCSVERASGLYTQHRRARQ